MAQAVLLPGSAMGGYAGLRVAAQRFPAVDAALQRARSQSWRSLLSAAKAPAAASRQAASRGAGAASRALASVATKAAPKLLGRAGLMAAGRIGLASIPVAGEVISVGTWLFDKDSRSLVNGLISCVNGVGFPPDGDAPPAPPRTKFLPLTNDGNRDPQIEKIDQGMTKTNVSAFNYDPNKVWPADPEIATTPDFSNTIATAGKLGKKTTGIADAIRAAANSITQSSVGKYAESVPAKLGPIADSFDEYHNSVLPAAAAGLNGVTTKSNEFYQKFREINNGNRAEIANSTSGLIPFRANHVNAAAMNDSITDAKAAATEIAKHNTALSSAYAGWNVPGPDPATLTSDVKKNSTAPSPAPPAPPAAPTAPIAPTGGDDTASRKSPQEPPLSSIPQIPGIPAGGGLPGGMPMPQIPSGAMGQPDHGLDPMAKELPLNDPDKDKALHKDDPDHKDDHKHTDNDQSKPDNPGSVIPTPPGAPATPPPPGADKTVRIGNKDYAFDSPRITSAVKETLQAAHTGPGIPIPQALADAGFTIPPAGQDLGSQVDDINAAKPGDVIVSDGNKNAWYLGNGEAMNEQGEVKPVNEVMNFSEPNTGIFHIPDPGTPIVDPTATPVAAGATSSSPPTVNAADVPPATPANGANPGVQSHGLPAGQPVPQHR